MLSILWDDWPIFMISGSNEQLQQELEYTPLKLDCHSWWISKMQSGREDTIEERYAIKLCFKYALTISFKLGRNAMRWKLDLLLWPRDPETDPRRPDGANPPTNYWWSLFWPHRHDLYALGSHWIDSQQGILCWGFKGVQERFIGKRPALFKSGEWHFHHDNIPVHNSILVTDYLTKMGINIVPHPPYSQDLAPCDFWLFPKLRSCRYESIEGLKEAVMKVIDTLTQEDSHQAFQKLLER